MAIISTCWNGSERIFWLDTARTAVRESVASLEEAAKQLIGAVTLAEGIYFAAISFSDLKGVMAVQGMQAWPRILLFVSPIVFWLVCLFFAVRVFTPENYKTNLRSPDLAERFYRDLDECVFYDWIAPISDRYETILLGYLLTVRA